jgi:3-methyladenine DNA glycosylase AlkD
MENIIETLREELIRQSDGRTREISQHFFKEKISVYGVNAKAVHSISKEFFSILKTKPKGEIFGLCDQLWQSVYIEESFVACDWSYFLHKKYERADFEVFEKWINEYVNNWASCDTLCNHTVGEFIMMYPEYIGRLKEFTRSGKRWTRRAAAVSLIVPARKGLFLNDILEIAGKLLLDKDDMVQKGYGWMLKVASMAHREEIFGFVMEHKQIMPRTALRYAIEKMPAELKALAMAR